MTAYEQPPAPVFSPDGRFVWQNNAWVPVPQQAAPGAAPSLGYPQPGYVAPVSPKSSGIAILLSFLWPGAGHLYVGANYPGGSNDKAIIFMVLSGVCFLLSLTLVGLIVSFPLRLGCAIYTMIDSNRITQAWNMARGLPARS